MRARRFVSVASVRAPEPANRGLVGPAGACLGIDIQALHAAPDDELVRVDYGANDDVPGALQFALGALGALLPVVVGREELVRVLHDLKNAQVILAAVPGEANGGRDLLAGTAAPPGARSLNPRFEKSRDCVRIGSNGFAGRSVA